MEFWLEYKFKDKFGVHESSASYYLESTTFEQALEEAQKKSSKIRSDGSGRLYRSFALTVRID